MSDKHIRELVRSLLLDMTPAQIVARVALELGFVPPPLVGVSPGAWNDTQAQMIAHAGFYEKKDPKWSDVWREISDRYTEGASILTSHPVPAKPKPEPRFPLAASLGVTEDEVVRAIETARQEGRQWLSEP